MEKIKAKIDTACDLLDKSVEKKITNPENYKKGTTDLLECYAQLQKMSDDKDTAKLKKQILRSLSKYP